MPPRGVKKGSKRARQYEHIKNSQVDQGRSEDRAEEIAARTVNKERARAGESRERSRTSTQDISSVAVAACARAPIARKDRRATSSTTRQSSSASRAVRR